MRISRHPTRTLRLLSAAALTATSLLALPRSAVHAAGGPVDTTVYVCDESHMQSAIRGAGGDGTVTFACSGIITLAATITLNKNLTIDGSGQSVTISGGNSVEVFVVNSGVAVTLNDLTIAYGLASSGGGIGNEGTLTVTNSTFSDNSANTGGGIANYGDLTVTNSTFSSNSAHCGGGIFNFGAPNLDAIGTLTVSNSTFSGNSDAICNQETGTADVANSILANSTSGPNCSGTITDLGGNLDSGTSCVGNNPRSDSLSDTDPMLDPNGLANNGGPTQTMALESTSPAIDLGVQPYCTEAEPQGAGGMDQRGYPRDTTITNPTCDAGAYEYTG